jgi:hypothetical protein
LEKLNIGLLGIIGILILVVFASGCTGSSNNTTSSNSTSSQQSSAISAPISVKVDASGAWLGTITDNTGSKSVSGSGSQSFQLSSNPGIVSVVIQKDNSKDAVVNGSITPDNSSLTVQIVDGQGKVVETKTTTADAGVVSVSHSF